MSSLNVNPEFNTEMEQLTPETRAHADRFNERYGQLLGNDAFLKGKLEDANTNIERAMAVAQGKSAGYVFNTYSELIAYIAVPENAEKFRLGDQFLIKATDVPDYWWDNTVTTAQTDSAGNLISGKNTSGKIIGALVELEARKIDLSKYDANDAALFNNMSDQYSSARTYDVGDICIHNNDLYKCVTAVEAAETFNASKWNKTSLAALHAEQEKKISENTRSLGLLSEEIQAVSKKQNFCKGSDRLLTDVLQIDFTNPTGESNSYGVIATEDASKLLNSPVADGAFYAYREVLTIKSASKDYKVIVRLTEAYPSPGRTWIKAYNPDISDWSDWKVI